MNREQETMNFDAPFDGADYDHERDHARLSGQAKRVFDCMKDGKWRVLKQIAVETGDPEASVSAQLRHLRKEKFGKHTVLRDHVGRGLYRYKLLPNAKLTNPEKGE